MSISVKIIQLFYLKILSLLNINYLMNCNFHLIRSNKNKSLVKKLQMKNTILKMQLYNLNTRDIKQRTILIIVRFNY